jgi:hypothetical protein
VSVIVVSGLEFTLILFRSVPMEFVMKTRTIFFLLLTTVFLTGCTSIFGGSSSTPQMAYIGDLSNNRIAQAGETIAYAKTDNENETFAYVFKGVDGKGGIHINKILRATGTTAKRTGVAGWFSSVSKPQSLELVYLPEQTLLVSPGVHIVFIKTSPSELHYRVIMTAG